MLLHVTTVLLRHTHPVTVLRRNVAHSANGHNRLYSECYWPQYSCVADPVRRTQPHILLLNTAAFYCTRHSYVDESYSIFISLSYRRMRWAGRVARVRGIRIACRTWSTWIISRAVSLIDLGDWASILDRDMKYFSTSRKNRLCSHTSSPTYNWEPLLRVKVVVAWI
jgi:hypothetical protein